MPAVFLGVDAGATKTHALLLSESGEVLGFGEGGSGNHETAGFGPACEEILKAVTAALQAASLKSSDLTHTVYSLAGADVSSDFEAIPEKIVSHVTGEAPFTLKNDSFGCLRGGTKDPFGVMVNCGTAQVAAGRNRAGTEIRLGGYGPEFGDFTGGLILAQRAVAAIVRADDGRGEETALTEKILGASGLDSVHAFIDHTYRDWEFLKSLNIARLVFEVSKAGDEVARELILEAASELTLTACALIRRLEMESETFDVIAAGSVFKGDDPVFMETIEREVHDLAPNARFTTPLYAPVVGAALLAVEAVGLDVNESMYAKLENGLPEDL